MFMTVPYPNKIIVSVAGRSVVPADRMLHTAAGETGTNANGMNRIKEIRDSLGVSQNELAKRLGTSHRQVAYLETGERRLTLEWLGRIAEALGVAPQDLIAEAVTMALRDDVQPLDLSTLGAVGEALAAKDLHIYRVVSDAVSGVGIQNNDTVTVEQSPTAISLMSDGNVALISMKGAKEPTARMLLRIFVLPDLFVSYRLSGQNVAVRRNDPSVTLDVLGVVVRRR